VDSWKSPSARYTHDKVATCIKNVKFKIINIRIGCQYVDYLCCSENLNCVEQNLRQGRMRPMSRGLDVAGSEANFARRCLSMLHSQIHVEKQRTD